MSCCTQRNLYSQQSYNQPSRFLREIPAHMLETVGKPKDKTEQYKPTQKSRPLSENLSRAVTKKPTYAPKAKADAGSFNVGDTVSHDKFGKGSIKSIVVMGDKHLAVIGFADGDKKMFLEFAPLQLER